jgi:hypothetical protein
MKTESNKQSSAEKSGFFQRIITKFDSVLKEKAAQQAKNSACCAPNSDDKDKGNKCC